MSRSLPDETELVHRAQDGELAAFGRLAELHSEPLWRCAWTLCSDDHEAEDLAQETFVEAWRSLRRFDGRCRFSTWLYGILRYRFLKARRKPRPVAGGDELAVDLPSCEANPPAAAEQAEEARLVHATLATLPKEHRAVLELRFFAGASLDEIATLLDCPLGTVKSRLHHGLEKLRRTKNGVNFFAVFGESSTTDTRARP
jgi:RNA polymerase sigma-70 factor (ECF subfamily)